MYCNDCYDIWAHWSIYVLSIASATETRFILITLSLSRRTHRSALISVLSLLNVMFTSLAACLAKLSAI